MMTFTKRLAIACGVAGALIAAPPALAATQSARAGDVSATFSYHVTRQSVRDGALTITRGGKVAYRRPLSAIVCGSQCLPGFLGVHSSSVRIVDLDHSGEPNVVVSLYTGGAHCCTVIQVFSYDATTHTYIRSQRDFGDPGAELADLGHDGKYEFVTADDRFAYLFTDYAASGLPIQILSFSGGHFHTVTRHYPALIAADAASWLKAFHGMAKLHYADSSGVVAAWAADEDLLGNYGIVYKYLSQQAVAGHLRSALYPTADSGQRFVSALEMFLADHGYVPGEHCM